MVYELQLITAADKEAFVTEFSRKFSWLRQRGCCLSVNTCLLHGTDWVRFDILLQGKAVSPDYREEDYVYIFKHQLAEFLAEHVIRDWESRLAWNEINKPKRCITPDDRPAVMVKATKFLKHCHANESLNLLMNYGRKNKITHRIFDYLFTHRLLVIEGFIKFCLPDFLTDIRFAVDLACEELRNEKEYNEFVKLLRYFVDTQPPMMLEVNIMTVEGTGFVLWDGNGVRIEEKHIKYYMEGIAHGEISLDDVLVSILITVAPRRIILHKMDQQGDSESVQMIKKVFDSRITVCGGCERCQEHQKQDYPQNAGKMLVKTYPNDQGY
ncbi:MAG: putative sporulation protein YtxC [Syntrophomonadaceae bacterium]